MNCVKGIRQCGFVWMAAMLLLAQPFAASYCPCCQSHASESSAKPSESSSCQRTGCGCSHKPAEPKSEGRVPGAPCDCPPNCPCQLQHVPKPVVKAQDVEVEQGDQICVLLEPSTVLSVERVTLRTVCLLEVGITPRDSALELCAALCRFTI